MKEKTLSNLEKTAKKWITSIDSFSKQSGNADKFEDVVKRIIINGQPLSEHFPSIKNLGIEMKTPDFIKILIKALAVSKLIIAELCDCSGSTDAVECRKQVLQKYAQKAWKDEELMEDVMSLVSSVVKLAIPQPIADLAFGLLTAALNIVWQNRNKIREWLKSLKCCACCLKNEKVENKSNMDFTLTQR